MQVLIIKDWDIHFENNRTREMKTMQWVPVPNKHDGDGFTELIQEKNGLELYGGWHLILQVASKCRPRGTLLRDSGQAHAAGSIARKTRSKEGSIQASIDACLRIGWLEYKTMPDIELQDGAEIPQALAEISQEPAWNGMEGNGREEKRNPLPPSLDSEEFRGTLARWLSYKKGRHETYKPEGLHSLLAQAGRKAEQHGIGQVLEAFETAMSNGWAGWNQNGSFGKSKKESKVKLADLYVAK